MNDLGVVWGFDGYDAAPLTGWQSCNVQCLQLKSTLYICISIHELFFFFFLSLLLFDLHLA